MTQEPQPPQEPKTAQAAQEDAEFQKLIEENRRRLQMIMGGVLCVVIIGVVIASNLAKNPPAPAPAPASQTQTAPVASGTAATTSTPASTPTSAPVALTPDEALITKAQEKGTATVVVGVKFDRPTTPEQMQQAEAKLKQTEEDISMRVTGTAGNITPHATMPEATMTVTAEQLRKLYADPFVTSVKEQ
jgi:hypothetical protein